MSNRIEVNGVKVNYTRTASNSNSSYTLMFLHGWGGTGKSWNVNVKDLSKNFNCISIDLPGFGQSSEPIDVWSIEQYADFVKNFASTLGVSKFVLIGKSFGGRVAIYYASKYSETLSHLILVASAGVEKKSILVYLKIIIAKIIKKVLYLFEENTSNKIQKLLFNLTGIDKDPYYKWEVKKLITNRDLTKESFQISTPTLIIWGENNQILPLKWGKLLNKNINNSQLRQIPGGHDSHIEFAQDFNNVVINFLSNPQL